MNWHMLITQIIPQISGSSWSSICQTGVGEKIGWRRMEFRLRGYKTQPDATTVVTVRHAPIAIQIPPVRNRPPIGHLRS